MICRTVAAQHELLNSQHLQPSDRSVPRSCVCVSLTTSVIADKLPRCVLFSITVLLVSKKYPLQITIFTDSSNSKNMKSATKKSVLFFADMVSHFATESGLLSLTRCQCEALECTPENQLGEKLLCTLLFTKSLNLTHVLSQRLSGALKNS